MNITVNDLKRNHILIFNVNHTYIEYNSLTVTLKLVHILGTSLKYFLYWPR